MNEQQNLELVKQCYLDFMRGDIPQLLSRCTPDIDWDIPAIDNVPFSGKRQGHDKVAEFFTQLNDMQTTDRFEPMEFVAQGDKVVVLGHYLWTVKSTGAQFESDWVHIFTVRDGKVAGFREFMDTLGADRSYNGTRAGMALGGMQKAEGSRPDAMH